MRLVQEPLVDAPGSTFVFEVNNQRIFLGGSTALQISRLLYADLVVPTACVGSNWVPCHYLLTTVKSETYRTHLQAVRDGNQNCVRVWSGGIYEPSVFYDTCDGVSPIYRLY